MKFLGHHRIKQLIDKGDVTPQNRDKNKKVCKCKVCGSSIQIDEGYKWLYFGIDNSGRDYITYFFLCNMCNTYWMTFFGGEFDLAALAP